MTDRSLSAQSTGFVAHEGIRPVLLVDFNEMDAGGVHGRMWAERGQWVMLPGQPVLLKEPGGGNPGRALMCDGHVVEIAPRNWKGERCAEYVLVQIADEPRWKDDA